MMKMSKWAGLMAGAVVVASMGVARAQEAAASAGDSFVIDRAHSTLEFRVQHLVISKVRGTFGDYTGSLALKDGKLESLEGAVKAATIDTANADRDKHVRSPDFLNADAHPEITFKSTAVQAAKLVGDLTINGVTRSVELAYSLNGPIQDPWGKTRLGLEASGTIDRQEFGLTWNQALEAGGVVVGNDVDILLNAEFIKK